MNIMRHVSSIAADIKSCMRNLQQSSNLACLQIMPIAAHFKLALVAADTEDTRFSNK